MLKIDRLPRPSGPYPVGFAHTSLIDAGRGLENSGSGNTPRELPIMIWYPAARLDGFPLKPYQPAGAFQLNYDLHYGLIGSLPWPLSWFFQRVFRKIQYVDIQTNAGVGAPLVAAPAALPLVIFFPGYTSLMTQNTILLEELASHGYVALAVGVPQETVCEYPDGRITGVAPWVLKEMLKKDNLLTNRQLAQLKKAARTDLAQLAETTRQFYAPTAQEANANMLAYTQFVHGRMRVWYQDLLYVSAHLNELAPIAGRVAADKIGVLGMSMGGGLASCAAYYRAPGVAAALSLDGCHYGMPHDTALEVPHLNIHGFSTSRLLFERTQTAAYSVTVADTAHLDYMDQTLLEPVYREFGYTGKKVNPERMLAIMNTYARAFFDRHIRGLETPVFAGRPPFDNVIVETK